MIDKGHCYQCESCKSIDSIKPWLCPICGVETCDQCFDRFGACSVCGAGIDDEALKLLVKWDDEDEAMR